MIFLYGTLFLWFPWKWLSYQATRLNPVLQKEISVAGCRLPWGFWWLSECFPTRIQRSRLLDWHLLFSAGLYSRYPWIRYVYPRLCTSVLPGRCPCLWHQFSSYRGEVLDGLISFRNTLSNRRSQFSSLWHSRWSCFYSPWWREKASWLLCIVFAGCQCLLFCWRCSLYRTRIISSCCFSGWCCKQCFPVRRRAGIDAWHPSLR